MAKQLDAELIRKAFAIMGEFLRDRKVLGEIAVYGGSAVILQFSTGRQLTQDVDVKVVSHDGLVRQAADHAARRLGLLRSWLSDGVVMYTSRAESERDMVSVGVFPEDGHPGLRVVAAGPRYLLAMKLIALERSTLTDRDFQDAVALGAEVGANTESDLLEIIEQFFPGEPIPANTSARLGEIGAAIAARRNGL